MAFYSRDVCIRKKCQFEFGISWQRCLYWYDWVKCKIIRKMSTEFYESYMNFMNYSWINQNDLTLKLDTLSFCSSKCKSILNKSNSQSLSCLIFSSIDQSCAGWKTWGFRVWMRNVNIFTFRQQTKYIVTDVIHTWNFHVF